MSAVALPPLVEPRRDLTPAEAERYSRHVILPEIGTIGQRRLGNARVLVVGAGGIGSPALLYLAAAGVGTLGIVDDDTVDLSNLQRQIIHGVGDVGGSKLDSVTAAVAELNPLVTIRRHGDRLDATNALALFADYDVILDGSDNFATRYLVSDAAAILGKPVVWGSIQRFHGQVSVFWNVHGPSYRDLYPDAPPPEAVSTCGESGVLGMLCGVIGSTMVSEVVKLITGVGQTLIGRLLVFDALNAAWQEFAIRRDDSRPPITALADYDAFCGVTPARILDVGDAVTSHDLAAMIQRRKHDRDDFELIDVREAGERELVVIPGSRHIPLGDILSGIALPGIPQHRDVVLYCKAGPLSAAAIAELRRHGFTRVKQLTGGVLGWLIEMDRSASRY